MALGTLTVNAQDSPNFTGTWHMDAGRSEAAAQETPIHSMVVTIRQSADELQIETTTNGVAETNTYRTNAARPTDNDGRRPTFRWDGSKLITTLYKEIGKQMIDITETRSLNPAGEMMVETTLVVQHGYEGTSRNTGDQPKNYATAKNVFVKTR
jgi:hypothetical protein